MHARLVSLDSNESFEIPTSEAPVSIGRSDEAMIRLNDRFVSRLHCRVMVVGDELLVRDLESRHGTFVNGESITEASVRSGDTLMIGMSRLRLETETSGQTHSDDEQLSLSS